MHVFCSRQSIEYQQPNLKAYLCYSHYQRLNHNIDEGPANNRKETKSSIWLCAIDGECNKVRERMDSVSRMKASVIQVHRKPSLSLAIVEHQRHRCFMAYVFNLTFRLIDFPLKAFQNCSTGRRLDVVDVRAAISEALVNSYQLNHFR